jgi:hypothetical protein
VKEEWERKERWRIGGGWRRRVDRRRVEEEGGGGGGWRSGRADRQKERWRREMANRRRMEEEVKERRRRRAEEWESRQTEGHGRRGSRGVMHLRRQKLQGKGTYDDTIILLVNGTGESLRFTKSDRPCKARFLILFLETSKENKRGG